MSVLGLVCEFNPFHNGHRYLIEKAKEETGCDAVIVVMSGNFTQRGLPAIADKHTRAEVAILNGVDLVLELPAAFTLHSAQYFAEKGIETLLATKMVDFLAFGSESGDLSELRYLLEKTDTEDYSEAVHRLSSFSLASALAHAAENETLFTPNNILGIEYLRALKKFNSKVIPYTCKRVGVSHDSQTTSVDFASASFLRNELYCGHEISHFAPPATYLPPSISVWEQIALYRLRTIEADVLVETPGVSEGLENRILCEAKKASSYEDLVSRIKTKRYTRSRIERIIACSILGIKKDHLLHQPYLRVLASTQKGLSLIRSIKTNTPVITKTADAHHPILDIECRCDDVYALLTRNKQGLQTFHHPPVIANK